MGLPVAKSHRLEKQSDFGCIIARTETGIGKLGAWRKNPGRKKGGEKKAENN